MDEYNALRAELVSKQDQKRSVWLHMYILYTALFALGFEWSYYLFLVTFIVVIPCQEAINNLEWNVSRISAYIRIFYESDGQMSNSSQRWETFNTQYEPYRDFFKKRLGGFLGFVRNGGSIHLGCLSTIFFVGNVLLKKHSNGFSFDLNIIDIFLILLSVILFVIVVLQNDSKMQRCEPELKKIMEDFKQECLSQQKIQ